MPANLGVWCFSRSRGRFASEGEYFRRRVAGRGLAVVLSLRAAVAFADEPPSRAAATASEPERIGLAITAAAGATAACLSLANAVYAFESLRSARIDDVRKKILCGEAPAEGAPGDVRDLAEMVADLRGDDAATRTLLAEIARRFSTKGAAVVSDRAPTPSARIFLAETGGFDAAGYAPDPGSALLWEGAAKSLVRTFGPSAEPAAGAARAAPVLATHEAPKVPRARRSEFYQSGWFWGALGAAAFAGGAIFLTTRDNSPSTIHLQLEVPH